MLSRLRGNAGVEPNLLDSKSGVLMYGPSHIPKGSLQLSFNPLTPRVKPWVIQSCLTFDSMDRTLKCDHSLESF